MAKHHHHHELKIEESGPAPVKTTDVGLFDNNRPNGDGGYTPSSSPTSASSVIELEEMKEKLAGDEEEEKDTTEVPVEVVSYLETSDQSIIDEDKMGLVYNVKEKLQGDEHKVVAPPPHAVAEGVGIEEKEKKGFLVKIKDKIPGFHSKSS